MKKVINQESFRSKGRKETPQLPGASNVVGFLNVKPGDRVLVLGDGQSDPEVVSSIKQSCYLATKHVEVDLDLPAPPHDEFPETYRSRMLKSDVVILLGGESWFHAPSWEKLYTEKGKRVAEGYGLQAVHFQLGGMFANPHEIQAVGDKVLKHIQPGVQLEVITDKGTNLHACVGESYGIESGDYGSSGGAGNLPPGELYILPKKATGIVIFDVNADILGRLDGDPVKVELDNNRVTNYSANGQPFFHDAHFLNLAEIAFGINIKANPESTSVLETEKVAGYGHCGFGGDSYFGGKVSGVHMDLIYGKVTLIVNGQTVIDKGKIL